jgi:hypothetical protein
MKVTIGPISEGTLRPEDLIPTFAGELRARGGENFVNTTLLYAEDYDPESFPSENVDWLLNELEDALNETAPLGTYFGTSEGDGACFGFWIDPAIVENPEEHGVLDLPAGTDLTTIVATVVGEPPAPYRGHLMLVGDHDNISFGYYDDKGFHETWLCT